MNHEFTLRYELPPDLDSDYVEEALFACRVRGHILFGIADGLLEIDVEYPDSLTGTGKKMAISKVKTVIKGALPELTFQSCKDH